MKSIKEKQKIQRKRKIKKITKNLQKDELFGDKKTAKKVAEKCFEMHNIDTKLTAQQRQKIMDTLEKNKKIVK